MFLHEYVCERPELGQLSHYRVACKSADIGMRTGGGPRKAPTKLPVRPTNWHVDRSKADKPLTGSS